MAVVVAKIKKKNKIECVLIAVPIVWCMGCVVERTR
jgi:hypothetical protein